MKLQLPRHFYWRLSTNIILAILILPLLFVASRSFFFEDSNWNHLSTNLLPLYTWNTSILLAGTIIMTLFIGVSTAWAVSIYEFPFRKQFEWMLILPLSIPTFISAISYVGLTDYAGPIRIFLRSIDSDIYFDLMTRSGAIFVMSIVLFPYVYVTSRSAFLLQSTSLIEVSRSLGQPMGKTFRKVILPLAWPSVFAGLILVIMEILNDYGVVSYFGIPTFTTGIFRSWLALGDLSSAISLSLIVLLFVLLLLIIDSRIKNNRKFVHERTDRNFSRIIPNKKWGIFLLCFIPLSLGFIIPVGQLIWWFILSFSSTQWSETLELAYNTTYIGVVSSSIIIMLGIILSYSFRLLKKKGIKKIITRLPFLGYAMPGAVIAIGVVAMVLYINPNWIYTGVSALVFGYTVRFFAVGYGSIESGFEKIPNQLDDAASSMGSNSFRNLIRIHLPILKPVVVGALIMVFVDVAKELPLTLILRPFNFDTLATNAFQYAKDEMAPKSAASSLLIIFASAIPVYFLNKILHRSES